VPTVSGPRPPHHRAPYSPPTVSAASAIASCGFKRSTPPTSSPFSHSSSAHPCLCSSSHHADVDRRTSVHRASPPPATPLLDRRLLELHPAPVHPSNSSPDHPSDSSPSLLPARCAPPRIASSVSPRPPQLFQSDSFRPDVAPCPLSPQSWTFGSPESVSTAAGSHGLCSLFPVTGQEASGPENVAGPQRVGPLWSPIEQWSFPISI
jgi:hypothetical protein